MQSFFDCDRPTAVGVVTDLMDSRLREFRHLVAEQLPVVLDDLELDAPARAAVSAWVRGLEHWIAGIFGWHAATTRYQEAELLARFGGGSAGTRTVPLGPTGLGKASLVPLSP